MSIEYQLSVDGVSIKCRSRISIEGIDQPLTESAFSTRDPTS